jgi:hypothetical protein
MQYVITSTRMLLPEALKAKGGSVKIKIDFSYISPKKVQTEF